MGLTAINCFGVRAGSNVQSALMLLKAAAIAAMVVAGILWGGGAVHPLPLLDRPVSLGLGSAIGAAMIPVAFAYGGWQTASFVAGEMRDPAARSVPRPDHGSNRSRGTLSRGKFCLRACPRS